MLGLGVFGLGREELNPEALCMLSICSTALAMRDACLSQEEAALSSPHGALINAAIVLMIFTKLLIGTCVDARRQVPFILLFLCDVQQLVCLEVRLLVWSCSTWILALQLCVQQSSPPHLAC